MRFITLSLIAWLFATALIAQTSQVTSQPMPNADSLIADVLSPLDLDQVPSGFLYDRIGEARQLLALDGQALTDTNYTIPLTYAISSGYLRHMDVSTNNVNLASSDPWLQATAADTFSNPTGLIP